MTRASDEQIAVVEKMRDGYLRDVEVLKQSPDVLERSSGIHANILIEAGTELADSLTAVLQELRELRAANEWVVTSERLPEESVECLATMKSSEYPEAPPLVRITTYNATILSDGEPCGWLGSVNVIAWKELPKPYNPMEENNGK